MNRFFNTLFWLLFGLRIVRMTAPWLAGIFVGLLLVMLLPMPPLLALVAFVVCTCYVAFELETKFFRGLDRSNSNPRMMYDPRQFDRRPRRRR